MIAAMSNRRVIGKNNRIPWHLPVDLEHFRQLTLHKPVIMGRKTFLSIGKALPLRQNIVISRNRHWHTHTAPSDVSVAYSIHQALALAKSTDEVIIMGGATLYEQMLPQTHRLYLTLIDADIEGDTFFPDYHQYSWTTRHQEKHIADAKNPYNYTFITLEKEIS